MSRLVCLSVFLVLMVSCQGQDATDANCGGTQQLLNSLQQVVNQAVSNLEAKIDDKLTQLQTKLSTKTQAKLGDVQNELINIEQALMQCLSSGRPTGEVAEALEPTCSRGMANDTLQRYKPLQLIKDPTLGSDILCDTQTDGGGWIVIQRRTEGNVDFYKGWEDYKNGFGTPPGDFWLGNEAIYNITRNNLYELRIDFNDSTDQSLYAVYDGFRLENEADGFRLRLGDHSGTLAEDSPSNGLSYHNNNKFSTFDKDFGATFDCPVRYHGAWWYAGCLQSNLNGKWGKLLSRSGVIWYTGSEYLLATATEMKIRRKEMNPV